MRNERARIKRVFLEIENELIVENGIFIFYCNGNKSIGASYEHSEETGELVYIFNLFIDDEYINICGEYKNIFDGASAILDEWNKYNK